MVSSALVSSDGRPILQLPSNLSYNVDTLNEGDFWTYDHTLLAVQIPYSLETAFPVITISVKEIIFMFQFSLLYEI